MHNIYAVSFGELNLIRPTPPISGCTCNRCKKARYYTMHPANKKPTSPAQLTRFESPLQATDFGRVAGDCCQPPPPKNRAGLFPSTRLKH